MVYSNLLRKCKANNVELFSNQERKRFYNFGTLDNAEWLVDEILSYDWGQNKLWFQV